MWLRLRHLVVAINIAAFVLVVLTAPAPDHLNIYGGSGALTFVLVFTTLCVFLWLVVAAMGTSIPLAHWRSSLLFYWIAWFIGFGMLLLRMGLPSADKEAIYRASVCAAIFFAPAGEVFMTQIYRNVRSMWDTPMFRMGDE